MCSYSLGLCRVYFILFLPAETEGVPNDSDHAGVSERPATPPRSRTMDTPTDELARASDTPTGDHARASDTPTGQDEAEIILEVLENLHIDGGPGKSPSKVGIFGANPNL